MPKKKRRDTQEKQSERFVKTARELGSDESGKEFNKAIDVLIKQKHHFEPKSK